MNEPKRVNIVWLVLIAFCASVIVFDLAYGGDDTIQSNDMNTVKGDIGYDSRAFALSGSDMDIRDCLATHSILFGIWQGTHTNPFCEAMRMDMDGNYQAAAEMRCSTRKYKKTYGKGQECIDAVIRTAPPTIEPVIIETEDNDDEDRYEALYSRMAAYEERTVKAEAEAKTALIQAQRVPEPVIIDYGAERRAKSRAAYEEALKGSEK